MTTFFWVKNSTASFPWPCIVPKKLSFQPLKNEELVIARDSASCVLESEDKKG